MSTVILFILILFFADAKIAKSNQFFDAYCSASKTNALKGIFVMCVFTSHFFSYVPAAEADAWGRGLVGSLEQLMVAPFLFYSGYGVAESIRKKGMPYIRKLGSQRALKTLVHFDIAVCLYFILHLLTGQSFTIRQLALSFVCWDSFGNSTWYIFAIVALYCVTAAAYRVFHKNTLLAAIAVTVLTLGLMLFLHRTRPTHWYNTMLCYVFGIWYSKVRVHIEKIVMRSDFVYCITALLSFGAFYICGMLKHHFMFYNLYAVSFIMLLILASMKLTLDNAFLQFLGTNTFGIYILQRLPMIFCKHYGIMQDQTVSLYIMCFLITCILSLAFSGILKKLDSKLFSAA